MPVYESILTVIGWQYGAVLTIPTMVAKGQGSSKRAAEHQAAVGILTQFREIHGLAWPELAMPPRKPSKLPAFEPVKAAVVDTSKWIVPLGVPTPAGHAKYQNGGRYQPNGSVYSY